MEIGQIGGAGNHVLELVEKVQDIDYEHAHPLHHQTEENIASVAQCKESIAIKKNALILVSNNEGKHHLNMSYFTFSFFLHSYVLYSAYILEDKIAIDDNFYWKTKDEEHVAGEREREMEK